MAVADNGYQGEKKVIQKKGDKMLSEQSRAFNTKVRARHETVNNRLKIFTCLTKPWRHTVEFHADTFFAVAVIVQIDLQYHPLFPLT